MPRYFFDTSNGVSNIDEEGTEFTDVAEARREAIMAAGAMFGEDGGVLASGEAWTMKISDDTGAVVCTIRFTINDSSSGFGNFAEGS